MASITRKWQVLRGTSKFHTEMAKFRRRWEKTRRGRESHTGMTTFLIWDGYFRTAMESSTTLVKSTNSHGDEKVHAAMDISATK